MQDLLKILIVFVTGAVFLWSFSALYSSLKGDLKEEGKDPDKEDGW